MVPCQVDEFCLLVPRKRVYLKEVDGSLESLDSQHMPFDKPLVITSEGEGATHEGVVSGGRSAIIRYYGSVFKLKGCCIEEAFKDGGPYRKTYKERDAFGGLLEVDASYEMMNAQIMRERFVSEGLPYPYEPIGIFHYEGEFSPNRGVLEYLARMMELLQPFSYIKVPIPRELQLSPKSLVATVMRIEGDTRLPEIYLLPEKSKSKVRDIAYLFGKSAGIQKKITTDSYWGRDGHKGNYVVFLKDGSIHLAMVDFIGLQKRYNDNKLHEFAIRRDNANLLRTLSPKHLFYVKLSSFFRAMSRLPPEHFRQSFTTGFNEGWGNPDKRENIPLELLCEAYRLNNSG